MSNQTKPTVKSPFQLVQPPPGPLTWSTNKPTIPGWYWCRFPSLSNTGWATTVVRIAVPQPGERLRVYPDSVTASPTPLDDKHWNRHQWSDKSITEPNPS